MTLTGMIITCTVTFTSYNPALKRNVNMTAEDIQCKVIDDSLERVGTPGLNMSPILVDCSKAIMWLKPTNTNGIFLFYKENKDCEYDYGKI